MRVVAGELGGRRLIAPPARLVRPTSDRVREALFSILGDVAGLTVLDLFAGTGALAIEAISRGAAAATLVDVSTAPARGERRAPSTRRSRRAGPSPTRSRFLRRDAGKFDLVFFDPPYRLARRFASDLETLLPARLAPGARVIVETAGRGSAELGMPLLDERVYGSTMIRIHGAG